MIEGLERFVGELRREGLSASPGEWLDALRAVERVGLADRTRFRLALCCTLVKRAGQRPIFDRVFERFFVGPARGPWEMRGASGGLGDSRAGDRGAALPPSGRRPRPPDDARREARHGRPALRRAESLARRLGAVRAGGPERRGRLRQVVLARGKEAEAEAARRPRAGRESPPERRDLRRRIGVEAEREIASRIGRVIERVRLRQSRRLRRAVRGPIDPRRVFRESAARGGVPFVLPRRRTRSRRARVVLLIDVSWSSALAAGLFLSVALACLRRNRDMRVLLFVDRAVDATVEIERWRAGLAAAERAPRSPSARPRLPRASRPGEGIVSGARSFAEVLTSLPGLNLDAPSDYGRVFHQLSRSRPFPASRGTLLLVLGDGRTNRFDPQAWAFEEMARGCGSVIWLVPEPVAEWDCGDSALGTYLVHADVAIEARDLEGLARGVIELVRRS